MRKFLVSGVMIDDEYEDTIVGMPQGGNISPLLANIMLNELDKELEARGLDFVRYADDLIIMVGSRQAADRVMKSVTRFIEERLGLKVNAEKSKVDKPKGIKYLGFGFYFDSFAKAYKARPHPKAVAKFKAQMSERKLTNFHSGAFSAHGGVSASYLNRWNVPCREPWQRRGRRGHPEALPRCVVRWG